VRLIILRLWRILVNAADLVVYKRVYGVMGEELAISLKNVSKCYKRYGRPVDKLKEVLLPGKNYAAEFWALRDIDLEVCIGETVGIIGQNGSGKSTLLQIIAGTLTPTTGTVHVNGRVSALLELGSGFNPEFTGRQNVFFNGRILGLSQQEIEDKFDEIEAFADIGEFIDEPVKTYSSGMIVRLAFAVVANSHPQILIVDEALAVGDIFFQQKCYKYLEKLKSQGTAILFVSHDTQAILRLCERAAILEYGYLTHSGIPSEMVTKYTEIHLSQYSNQLAEKDKSQIEELVEKQINLMNDNLDNVILPSEFRCDFPSKHRYGSTVGMIAGIAITNKHGESQTVFSVGEEIILSVKVNSHSIELCPLNIGFQLNDRFGQIIIGTNTSMLSVLLEQDRTGEGFICQFRFKLSIIPQQYTIHVAITEYENNPKVVYDWINFVQVIDVVVDGELKQAGIHFADIVVKTQ
jgi:lipopolysaccharide transport system ATP-binding protein